MTPFVFEGFLYSDPDPEVIWLKKAMLLMAFLGPPVVLSLYFFVGR